VSCKVLQQVAKCCSELQRVVASYNVIQYAIRRHRCQYGVALVVRINTIVGLFCQKAL